MQLDDLLGLTLIVNNILVTSVDLYFLANLPKNGLKDHKIHIND